MPIPRPIWKTGVYLITNTVNGKLYVGSCAELTRGIKGRWNSHKRKLRRDEHSNQHLQKAWNKYGEAAFEFSVLVHCEPELCICNEQVFIDRLRASNKQFGYNITPTAGNVFGMKLSKEARAKIAANNTGRSLSKEAKDRIGAANRGRSPSAETRRKISEAGRKRIQSTDTRAKIGEANRGRKHSEKAKEKMSLTKRIKYAELRDAATPSQPLG